MRGPMWARPPEVWHAALRCRAKDRDARADDRGRPGNGAGPASLSARSDRRVRRPQRAGHRHRRDSARHDQSDRRSRRRCRAHGGCAAHAGDPAPHDAARHAEAQGAAPQEGEVNMSTVSRRPEADPLYAGPLPQRAAYATGMLLDAQDFVDEQTYHRGRLARALAFLAGGGTLAGLKVTYRAKDATHPEEIQVAPGVAVDRLGRLVEVPRPACLRLDRWFDGEAARDGGDTLRRAALGQFTNATSKRIEPAGALPARAVVADVFLRFVACENGLTPSFAAGPFDALDAVSASRVRDA